MRVHNVSGLKRVSPEYSGFVLVTLIGVLFSTLWLYVGEPWGIRGDAQHYIQLYEGEKARSPFGYRVLTPWLAQLLFSSMWSYWMSFKIIAITCLSLCTGFIYLLMAKKSMVMFQTISIIIFWITSFAFVYYTTTIIRPDSLMFLLLFILFLASNDGYPYWLLLLLLSVGVFAHETILVFIPAIWLDKIFNGTFTNGNVYKAWQLIIVTAGAIIVFIVGRKLIEVLPETGHNYLNSPIQMIRYSLTYGGGVLKYILRIYAAFGPVLTFSFFYGVFFLEKRNAFSFFTLFFIVVAATFLATDTLRVMAIICMPVFFYATQYVFKLWNSGARVTAISLMALQVLYSSVVFGHLRTFEKSFTLNAIAASISVMAFLVCAVSTYRAPRASALLSRFKSSE